MYTTLEGMNYVFPKYVYYIGVYELPFPKSNSITDVQQSEIS